MSKIFFSRLKSANFTALYHTTAQILQLMNIDKPLLRKLMHMSRLELTESAEVAMLSDLNKICNWMGKLDELDTEGVRPLMTKCLEENVMREDIPQAPLPHVQGLSTAPCSDSDYFRVPKIKD